MSQRNISLPVAQNKKPESLTSNTTRKRKLHLNNTTSIQPIQGPATVPNVATLKPIQNKAAPELSGTVVKNAKKSEWKPKPAHSFNNTTSIQPIQGPATVSNVATLKPKQNKSVSEPSGTVVKKAKKSARRPKPAHSGVPVPEKMRNIIMKSLD